MSLLPTWSLVAYDEGTATSDPPSKEGTAQSGGEGKTYSQQEFDTHLAGQRRKYESQLAETKEQLEQMNTLQRQLAAQLEQAKSSKGLTEKERQRMEQQIEELRASYESDTEKAERLRKSQEEQFTGQINSLQEEVGTWQSMWKQDAVRSEIGVATSKYNGTDPDQFSAILGPHIEYITEDENGERLRRPVPFVTSIPGDVDTEGKPVKTRYNSIDEAMARMKELPKYRNLFNDTMTGGIGGSGNPLPQGKDPSKLLNDTAAMMKLYKEDKTAYYKVLEQARKGSA